MISARCPICKREVRAASIDDLPTFPFCSERCRLIDLGRWIDGDYAVPGPPAPEGGEAGPPGGAEGEHE